MRKPILFAVLVVLAAALAARADVIHLKNGRTLEGKVLGESGGKVKVRTVGGVVEISRADIERIEVVKTPREVYEERLAALAPDDADGCFELALYCRENHLPKEEKELYAKALAIDPQHPGANEAVGNVRVDGEWMTPAEAERRKADAEEAAMRAKGLVKYDGQWVTPEDREKLEKGLVKYEGKWMTPDEVKQAQGYVNLNGRWVRKEELEREQLKDLYGGFMGLDVNVVLTEHVAAVGPFTEEELGALAQGGEQAYAQFCEIFGVTDASELLAGAEVDDGRKRLHVVYSKRALEYVRLVDGMRERYPEDIAEDRAEYLKTQKGFYNVYPSAFVGGYQMPNPFEQIRASVVHKTSHVLLMRWHYVSGFFPWWLIEGLGTYQEIAALGRCDTYCTTLGGYGVGIDPAKLKWAGLAGFKDIVKTEVAGNSDRTLLQLSKCSLNELSIKDIAKCWSLCEWLISRDRASFVKLVENLKMNMEFGEAVEKAFGRPPEKLDRDWHDYVRSNY